MGISPSTVRNLQSRAAKKLGVGSLNELSPFQRAAAEPKAPHHCSMAAPLPYLFVFGSALPVGAARAGGWIEAVLAGQILLALGLGLVAACSGRTKRTAIPQAPLYGVAALLGACAVAEVAGLAQGTLFVFVARAAALVSLALVVASARAAGDCVFAPRDVACISAACLPALLVGGPGAALCSCSFGILALYVGRKKDTRSLATLVASFGLGSAVGARLSWSLVCTGELLALAGSMGGRCRRGFSCESGNGLRRRYGNRLGGRALLGLSCPTRHLSAARAINRFRRSGERPLPSARPQRDMHFRCDSSYWGDERP